MVSEQNIAFLRKRKARYLVGTPKSHLREFEKQLLEREGWQEVQDGLEARLLPHPDGEGHEQYVLCRSSARAEKERAMLARQSERLCEELGKINAALRRQPEPDLEKLGRRIGRHQGKSPAAAGLIEVDVQRDENGTAIALSISSPLNKGQNRHRRHGAYLLRTNCTETDPAQLWRWYIQLTQAEAALTHAPPHGAFALRAARSSQSVSLPAPGSSAPHRQKRPQTAPRLSSENRSRRSPHPCLLSGPGPVAGA